MKVNKKILMMLLLTGIFWLFHTRCYAGTQKLNSLDYNVQLNSDGSMDVVETWDIYVSETNTLFKNFEIDANKYTGITNVKVTDLETELDLKQIEQEMYHVTKGCYYGLPVSGDKFEIAWGVGLDDSSANRKYQISYTIQDIVTVYNDCNELYWQFVGTENAMKAKKVTGTIKLPQAVENLENLRIWAHGPLNGEVLKDSKDTVIFKVDNFSAETMLEVRIVIQEPMFDKHVRNLSKDKLEEILIEETEWANEANQKRKQTRIKVIAILIVYLLICFFFLKKIIRYKKEMKSFPKNAYQIDIGQYFRDIPREKEATPAEAAFLYYKQLNGKENRIISATLLQLCLKGYISFEKEGKADIRIDLLKPSDENLKLTEQIIYRILTWPRGVSERKTVTMKEITNFMGKHYDESDLLMKELRKRAQETQKVLGNYDEMAAKQALRYKGKSSVYGIAIIVGVLFLSPVVLPLLPIFIEWGISAYLLSKTAKRIPVLTEKGETEKQEWVGLKNYMEDFSLLKEREIPDLVLWEKYLVYATVFGISEKVIKQLKVVYPQIQNLESTSYTYLYLMSDTRFANGFIEDLNRSTLGAYEKYRSAYSEAHSASSSGSGSGGGFSSGGGGRWRWRPEWVVVKHFETGEKV